MGEQKPNLPEDSEERGQQSKDGFSDYERPTKAGDPRQWSDQKEPVDAVSPDIRQPVDVPGSPRRGDDDRLPPDRTGDPLHESERPEVQ